MFELAEEILNLRDRKMKAIQDGDHDAVGYCSFRIEEAAGKLAKYLVNLQGEMLGEKQAEREYHE